MRAVSTLAIAAGLWLGGCAGRDPLRLMVSGDGILGDIDDPRITWYCDISGDDREVCRGLADRNLVDLRYDGQAVPVARYTRVMLYRKSGHFVGLQLHRATADPDLMFDTFGGVVENRYDGSKAPVLRACGRSDVRAAIASAQANINTPEAGVCADLGLVEVSWRFYRYMDDPDPLRRVVQLTVRAPDMVGPDSWWF